jgi:hypothetical protein
MKIVSIVLSLAIGTAFAETVPTTTTTTQPIPETTEQPKPLKVRANLNQWRKEIQDKKDIEMAEMLKTTKDEK